MLTDNMAIVSTTTKPTSTTLAQSHQPSASQGNDNLASLHLIMSYSAVSTTLLVVVLLAFVAYYIHRKKLAKEKSRRYDYPVGYRTGLNKGRNYDPDEGQLLQEITLDNREICSQCGQRPRPELRETENAPPSYATCDQGRLLFSRSDTPSTPSSTESVQNTAKTGLVKPMPAKAQVKVNNNSTTGSTRHKVLNDAGMQTPLCESLINSHETQDNDETSLKMSNI
ncbi:uncharacterized protein LOC123564582 isoform X2 [Mercenaria mercenaria]|uniref:uncharacterized protein LOC123564582 isoform X2 n=1 Tax=Mercenaria mercenaria TaxID=6596 RepID=UPI00234ECC42|nr:uncharacterized protein LOC123564582 isoform X2 [Mercenaria mercenaria]